MELHFDHSKYLGVLLDDKMNWQYHIASVCARVAQSTGIFYKLRHFLPPRSYDKSIIPLSIHTSPMLSLLGGVHIRPTSTNYK